MNSCKVFVPCGAIGAGISKQAFYQGIDKKPDIISSDAGSTDSGPFYLGTGTCKYAREALKEDMRLMMVAAKQLAIPITIGSCGTCGNDAGVDEFASICLEICDEEGLSFTIAKVYTQQHPDTLIMRYHQGHIHPLEGAPAITADTFKACSNIVALAGVEPFITALEAGADIVLCGRATDTAIIAAMPIMKGCNVAAAWHGAKIAECGDQCTTNPSGGGVFLTFDEYGFTVEPTAENSTCTVYSVSAHMLYENANPFRLTEPSGAIDVTNSVYTQLDGRTVRVTGTTFVPAAQYTMKLEGAAPLGYQTLSFVGIQDRRIMQNPMRWIHALSDYATTRLTQLGLSGDYSFALKPYGWNAVSGESIEAGTYIPREIGVMLITTGKTQEVATKIAKIFNPLLLHFPVTLDEQLPSFAFPFSPAEIERGPIYEFKLHHVVDVEDPLELVRINYVHVNKGR
jgi:Acyclic terpene utilisation family protein AtuA